MELSHTPSQAAGDSMSPLLSASDFLFSSRDDRLSVLLLSIYGAQCALGILEGEEGMISPWNSLDLGSKDRV